MKCHRYRCGLSIKKRAPLAYCDCNGGHTDKITAHRTELSRCADTKWRASDIN